MQISRNQEEGRWEFLPSWRSADVPDLKELLSKMLNDLTWNLRGSRKPSGLSVHLFLKCRRLPANDQTGSHFEEQLVRLLFSASADGCILTPTDVPALVSSAAGLIKSDLRRQKANQIAKEEVSEGRSVRPAGSRGGSDGKKWLFTDDESESQWSWFGSYVWTLSSVKTLLLLRPSGSAHRQVSRLRLHEVCTTDLKERMKFDDKKKRWTELLMFRLTLIFLEI